MDYNSFTVELKEFFGWLIEHYINALAENIELRKQLEEAKKEIAFLRDDND
jgi:hypothetical protein